VSQKHFLEKSESKMCAALLAQYFVLKTLLKTLLDVVKTEIVMVTYLHFF
jgi:hypothetical protein